MTTLGELEELEKLYQRLKSLSAQLENAKFKNSKEIFREYFKTCAGFLEGLAKALEEDKDDPNVKRFLEPYIGIRKDSEFVFRPIAVYEIENVFEEHNLARLYEGYKKLKSILEDERNKKPHSTSIQSQLEFLKNHIEDSIGRHGLYFLTLLLKQGERLEKIWQEQESASRSYLEAKQAAFETLFHEKKETLDAQLQSLTARHKKLVEDCEKQKEVYSTQSKNLTARYNELLEDYEKQRKDFDAKSRRQEKDFDAKSHLFTYQHGELLKNQREVYVAQSKNLTARHNELLKDYEKQREAYNTELQSLTARHNELLEDYEEQREAYRTQSQGFTDQHDQLLTKQREIYRAQSQKYEEAYNTKLQSLTARHNELLKDYEEQKKTFDELIAQHQELFEEDRSNREQKAQELENKIEALLPGAGTVGLAKSYFDAKRRYGYVPYHEMSKKSEDTHDKGNSGNVKEFWQWAKRIGQWAKHVVVSSPHLLFDLGFFALPLIALIWVNYDKGPPESFYALLGLIVQNIGFFILAFFGLQSIGRKRSLYEEYNHKQRVMTLFAAFKKEVEEDPEQKKELFKVALKTVDERPKSIYYDIEKKGFLDRFLGGRSKGDSSQKDSKSEKQSTDASPRSQRTQIESFLAERRNGGAAVCRPLH